MGFEPSTVYLFEILLPSELLRLIKEDGNAKMPFFID